MQTERMSPKIDIVFQALFGAESNKPILLDLLNIALGREEGQLLTEAVAISLPKAVSSQEDEGTRLRWRMTDQQQHTWHVEVQCHNRWLAIDRVLQEWAKMVAFPWAEDVGATERHPSILLIFADLPILKNQELYRTHWVWSDLHHQQDLKDYAQICLIELPKCRVDEKNAVTLLDQWIFFLKEGDHLPFTLIESWGDDMLQNAFAALESLSRNPSFQKKYEQRFQNLQEYLGGMRESYRDGLKKGRKSERETLAQKLLGRGFAPKEVAELTNLTEEELRGLS